MNWWELEQLLERIKADLFHTSVLDCSCLGNVDEIYELNDTALTDEEFYVLVKRAAAEVLLEQDLNKSRGNPPRREQRRSGSAKRAPSSQGRRSSTQVIPLNLTSHATLNLISNDTRYACEAADSRAGNVHENAIDTSLQDHGNSHFCTHCSMGIPMC